MHTCRLARLNTLKNKKLKPHVNFDFFLFNIEDQTYNIFFNYLTHFMSFRINFNLVTKHMI